jgi:hypothetical protein
MSVLIGLALAVGVGILLGRAGRWLAAWRLDRRIDSLRSISAEARLLEALAPYPRHAKRRR